MTLAQLKRRHGVLHPEPAAWVDYDGPVQRGPVAGEAKHRIGDGSVLILALILALGRYWYEATTSLEASGAECSDAA